MTSFSVPRTAAVACVLISCALWCSCGTNTAPVTSATAHLTQVTIVPANKSVPKGATLQFSATGIFSDGTQQDVTSSATWQVTPASVASINAQGELEALGVGVAQVSATYQEMVGNASTTVGPPALIQLALSAKQSSLPVGESEALMATGTFTDGSTQNLTDSVTWQAGPSTVASINAQGELKGLTEGTAQITATSAGVSGNMPITVGPPALLQIALTATQTSLPVGETESVTALGSFSDGSSQNLTSSVTWMVSPPTVATINAQGNLKALTTGVAQVSASFQGVSGSSSITIAPAALLQIGVSYQQASLPIGESEALTATGSFSDGSKQNLTHSVTWVVSPANVASINAQGNLKGLSQGVAQVSAASQGVSGSASIAIGQAALLQIAVTSQQPSLPVGESESLTAMGSFSDGSKQNLTSSVTWTVTPATVASINGQGNLKGLTQGVAQVSAAFAGVTGSTSIAIGQAALLQIAVSSAQPSLPLGESESLTAMGSFSDGSKQNLTSSVSWTASPSTVASINAEGNLKALTRGVAQVSAAFQGITGSTSVTVGPAALLQIALTPASSSLPLGESEAMTATGSFSDGSQQNLTASATWSSSAQAIAAVNATGNVTAKSLGSTTIHASVGSVSGAASLTVSAPVVVGLNIMPATSSLVIGSTGVLQAIASLSDGTTQNLTSTATWSSSQPAIAAVSGGGVITADQVGSATIVATISEQSNNFSASALLTVTPLMSVSYFNRANSVASGVDGTLQLTNPGYTTGNLCAMVYVFDQQQELNECCGCTISHDGMRTLSLLKDLTGNTLTGKEPVAGTIEIVPANPGANGACDPGSPSPNSMLPGFETNVQGSTGAYQVTEIPLATTPLASVQAQVLAAECGIVEQLGEGRGVCTCGSGD